MSEPSPETEAHTEIFDSLPYYDNDLEKYPTLKQKVEQELAREPKPPQALHPRVPPPIILFAVRRSFTMGTSSHAFYLEESTPRSRACTNRIS
jgi:hypothetical protein